MNDRVAIKGARGGIRVVVDEACSWSDAFNDIQHQLTQNVALLNGVKVSFELGGRMLAETDIQALQAIVTQHHVADFELQTNSRDARQLARSLGVAARPMGLRAENRTSDPLGAIVMRNLRNGQVLKHHGDLTLLGVLIPVTNKLETGEERERLIGIVVVEHAAACPEGMNLAIAVNQHLHSSVVCKRSVEHQFG